MTKGCAGFTTRGDKYTPFLRCSDCDLEDSDTKCAEYRWRAGGRILDVYNPTMWNWNQNIFERDD